MDKKSFSIKKIIFIENSNYDFILIFHELARNHKNKEIEILSTNLNSSFNKKLGKGYGQFLCLNEVFQKSTIAKKN